MPQIRKAAEIVALRFVPGVINLVAFLALAAWLTPESYGIASTYIATSVAASNLLFGPLFHSVLVNHSDHWRRGEQSRFESAHVTNTLIVAAAVAAIGLLLVAAGLVDWRIVAAAIAVGAYMSILEIPHARTQFGRVAVGSTIQSVGFLLLAFVVVRQDPTVDRALEAFALSHAVAAAVSALLVKARPARPRLQSLKAAFALGTSPTLSNIVVDAFTLGSRYLLMIFGQLGALGTFSFSVDLAQRSVGIFVNLATYAMVPQALRASAGTDVRQLWNRLARGWMWAVAAAVLSAAAIVALSYTPFFPVPDGSVFDPLSFALVALAVIVNRSGKMIFNPVAMRLQRTRLLLTPLIVIAPAALATVAAGIALRLPYAVEIVYMLMFISWVAASYRLLAPLVSDSPNGSEPSLASTRKPSA